MTPQEIQMAATLNRILHWETLTENVNDPRNGLLTPNVPESFMTVRRGIVGVDLKYHRVEGTRQTAIIAQRASASQRQDMKGVTEEFATLLFSNQHMMHDVSMLENLRNFENVQLQRMGRAELARQVALTRTYIDNLRVAQTMSALFSGKIRYTFGLGLHDPNGATGTLIDFGIPAGNRDQLNFDGGGNIIDASWAIASTDIPAQIQSIIDAGMRLTGYPLVHAFYGKNIRTYLGTNDAIKTYVGGNEALSGSFARNIIPAGFMDLQWHSASGLFFNDENDQVVDLVPADAIVFTPEPSQEWWDPTEGTFEVPTTNAISASVDAALNQFATVQGRFNWAKVSQDPSGIKHVYGDTFMPVIKVPKALFIADVTP